MNGGRTTPTPFAWACFGVAALAVAVGILAVCLCAAYAALRPSW